MRIKYTFPGIPVPGIPKHIFKYISLTLLFGVAIYYSITLFYPFFRKNIKTFQFSPITCGNDHTCYISFSGNIYCWGRNNYGQLGDGTTTDRETPVLVQRLDQKAIQISTGFNHTCALLSDGYVRCWGNNEKGQLGNGTNLNSPYPVKVDDLTEKATTISTGGDHSCFITEREVIKCWGWNKFGQLGDGSYTNRSSPTPISNLMDDARLLACGEGHTCVVTTYSDVYCWGANFWGTLGDGTSLQLKESISKNGEYQPLPTKVKTDDSDIISIGAGAKGTCVLKANGEIKCWGLYFKYPYIGEDAINAKFASVPEIAREFPLNTVEISVGKGSICLLNKYGDVYCEGQNWPNIVNVDDFFEKPTRIKGLPGPSVAIDVGSDHSCVIMENNDIWCWGSNSYGKLGNPSPRILMEPLKVRF